VSRRARIASLALLGALVLAGAACAVLVGGITGEILTIILISAGLGGVLVLVFLEIGFGEERDLAREQARRERRRRRLAARRALITRRRRPG
jgi:fatty acid desaturase